MSNDLTFEEKVLNGEFNNTYLTKLKKDLKEQIANGKILKINIPSAKFKIDTINKYLRQQFSVVEPKQNTNTPVQTTRKTITLNKTKEAVTGGDTTVTDEHVARKFLQVQDSAKQRGVTFSLNLVSVRNLLKAKKCYYTGLPFDHADPESSLTFDRIDHNKGYEKGNVVACRKSVNDLKNILIEHPVSVFKDNPTLLKKVVEKWIV